MARWTSPPAPADAHDLRVIRPAEAPGVLRAWRSGVLVLAALALAALALRFVQETGVPAAQNFLIVFGSLLIEAFPFILLGAVVSAAIEVFVPARAFERLARLPRALQGPVAGLGGFAFPVCECGSVPVARRLAAKGLAPSAAVTFMLAAPVLNPVVLLSTVIAYRGRDVMWVMVLGRAGLALIVAVVVGWLIGNRTPRELLKSRGGDGARPEEDHHAEPRWKAFFGHLGDDFVFLGRFLVVGGAVAAGLQTFIPQSILGTVAGAPVLNILALMVLAALLSLCSESDAFVAASFVQFGPAAQLAFLVFGPMVDAKLGFLYAGTFTRGFLPTVVIGVAAVTLAGTLWLEVVFG